MHLPDELLLRRFKPVIFHLKYPIFFVLGIGGFGDTAFFHRETKTLLVTDAVIRVDNEAPEIIQEDPRALLYHSRDFMTEIIEDTPKNRQKGWRRMVLFGLTFQPAGTLHTVYPKFMRMRMKMKMRMGVILRMGMLDSSVYSCHTQLNLTEGRII